MKFTALLCCYSLIFSQIQIGYAQDTFLKRVNDNFNIANVVADMREISKDYPIDYIPIRDANHCFVRVTDARDKDFSTDLTVPVSLSAIGLAGGAAAGYLTFGATIKSSQQTKLNAQRAYNQSREDILMWKTKAALKTDQALNKEREARFALAQRGLQGDPIKLQKKTITAYEAKELELKRFSSGDIINRNGEDIFIIRRPNGLPDSYLTPTQLDANIETYNNIIAKRAGTPNELQGYKDFVEQLEGLKKIGPQFSAGKKQYYGASGLGLTEVREARVKLERLRREFKALETEASYLNPIAQKQREANALVREAHTASNEAKNLAEGAELASNEALEKVTTAGKALPRALKITAASAVLGMAAGGLDLYYQYSEKEEDEYTYIGNIFGGRGVRDLCNRAFDPKNPNAAKIRTAIDSALISVEPFFAMRTAREADKSKTDAPVTASVLSLQPGLKQTGKK